MSCEFLCGNFPKAANIRCYNLTVDGTYTGPSPGAPVTGSWTTSLLFNTSSTGITYSVPPTGTYVSTGNIVFIQGSMQLSSLGSFSGDAIPTIAGLPFPVGASVIPTNLSCTWGNCPLDTNATTVTAHSVPASSTLTLNMTYSTGTAEIALYNMFMSNTSVINFSGFYFTS
jgi:hypothetical protein